MTAPNAATPPQAPPAAAQPAGRPASDLSADQVTLTVIDNYLATTCREMGIAMMRTAYSPMFNESLDFSCVLFDAKGRLIAQAEFCPSQIGTIKFTVEWMIDELGPDVYRPGDVIIMNDPYRGSGHIPEHTLLKAVFDGGEIVGFVANCAHLAEPGAKAPGGLAGDATDIFQEGLRIPPLWLHREGVPQEDVWKIIFANHRTPKTTYGDLMAMVGSLNVAERRLISLIDTYGHGTVTAATEDLIGIAERRMAEEIRRIPDGEYRFSDIIEDDGVAEGSYVIDCTVVVDGGDVACDFTGSSSQAAGPMNATYAVTASAVYNAFMHITDPTIPRNEGCYRPINIVAPPGTILNCEFPAPLVGGNTEVSPRITDIIFGALADPLPERIPASLGGTSCCFLFGGQHPDTGDLYSHFHFEGIGWGGRPAADGNSQIIVINGNCRNTPVEVFETRYPLRVESYRLLEDSGGPGLNRGGLGIERVLTMTAEEVTVSAIFNRMLVDPFGIHGGKPGANSGIYVRLAGEEAWSTFSDRFGTMSPSKFSNIRLRRGDQVRIVAPGGGGWGDPLQRAAERVVADVAEGLVTPEAARRDYGLTVERRNGTWGATPTPARAAAP
ncbi:MAG: hydantoinase B/oxoprolinase family protein [bacterium]|nr:hydantoinase B/oxoprolinase family protein [bacterium]MXZ30296.1 hydantoinase B/oxoprolinase family protein [Acidimicrobiia bacterium]MYB24594.1 hydantoinase B/oxoprolinase family protein [Acidimicrobiia bacterium]